VSSYEATADALVKRILEAFRAHPESASITDAWDLFKVPGFKCSDLEPSLAQAGWALSRAKKLYAEEAGA
jgi:hypothetical protein